MVKGKDEVRVTVKLFNQEFNKGMKDMRDESGKLKREFQLQEAQMKDTASESEKFSAKIDYLKKQHELAGKKVQETSKQYDAIRAKFGENSKAAQDMAKKLDYARIEEQKLANEISDTNKSLKEQQKSLKDTGDRLQDFGGQMQAAGQEIATTFGVATAAVAGGLTIAANKAMDFEAQMSSVKSVMAPDEIESFGGALEALAVKLGAETKYSAQEAAIGIEELIKAGVSITDILNGGLSGALSLATAGGLDLGAAAEVASTALNAFRDDGLSVSKAADILAGAANASATNVEELRYGLQMVSAVASGAGLSFEDTTTALAAFAQNGLKGSDAGTSLKTMLMNLTPSTEAASTVMSDLGIITKDGANQFYTATGELKSLSEITGVLHDALDELNPQERGEALREMFGSDAIRAGNIFFKEGAEGIDKMAEAMGKISAADVAAEKLDNVRGQIEELRGATDTALISLGNKLLPVISKLTEVIQGAVDKFNNLSPQMQKIIAIGGLVATVILGVITVIGILMVIIGSVVTAIGTITTTLAPLIASFTKAGGIIGLLTNPITLVIAAVAALVAIFIVLYNNNEAFRNKVLEIWQSIQTAFQTALSFIMSIVQSVMTSVTEFFSSQLAVIRQFWDENGAQIMSLVKIYFESIWAKIQLVMGLIKGLFQMVWPIISGAVKIAWGIIQVTIKNTLAIVLSVIQFFLKIFKGDWQGAFDTIKNTVSTIMKNIVSTFRSINLLQIGKDIINGLVNGISSMGGAVKRMVSKLASNIPSWAKKVLGIKSPSTVMIEVGEDTGEGAVIGVERKVKEAKRIAAELAQSFIPQQSKKLSIAGIGHSLNAAIPKLQKESIQAAYKRHMLINLTVISELDGYEVARNQINYLDPMMSDKAGTEFYMKGERK